MSIGRTVVSTAVMILTGKLVNEGFEKAKKRIKDYKEYEQHRRQQAAEGEATVRQVEQ